MRAGCRATLAQAARRAATANSHTLYLLLGNVRTQHKQATSRPTGLIALVESEDPSLGMVTPAQATHPGAQAIGVAPEGTEVAQDRDLTAPDCVRGRV